MGEGLTNKSFADANETLLSTDDHEFVSVSVGADMSRTRSGEAAVLL